MSTVTTKGYAITTGFTEVLPVHSVRLATEIQNQTTGILYMYVGETPTDADSLQLPVGTGVHQSTIPLGSQVWMRSVVAGNVVVVAAGQ